MILVTIPIIVVLATLFLRPRFEINDYETCAKAKGSLIMESYPEQCISKNGNRFVRVISD